MSVLETLFGRYNRQGINAASFGPRVIAVGKDIPDIQPRSFISFGDVEFKGNVYVGPYATVRMNTRVIGTSARQARIESYAVLMDNIDVESATLQHHAGLGHGSEIRHATMGPWAFGNIRTSINGTPVAETFVQSAAFLGPGVEVPAGVTVDARYIYMGNPVFAGPRAKVDAQFHVHPEVHFDEAAAKAGKPGAALLLRDATMPRNIDLAGTINVAFTELKYTGADAWVKEKQSTERGHFSREEWLKYYPNQQLLKQLQYNLADAKTFGDIVWDGPALQSEILHLGRAHRILAATQASPELREDLKQLIQAKQYLLGVYKPQEGDKPDLERALLNADKILHGVARALRVPPKSIRIFAEETAGNVLGETFNGLAITITEHDINKLAIYLGEAANRATNAIKAYAELPEASDKPRRVAAHVESWIAAANPKRINMLTISDGPYVQEYAGLVPVIGKDAILVGKVDLLGATEVDGIVEDSSIRSEQNAAPIYVGRNAYIGPAKSSDQTEEQPNRRKGTIIHTALNEQRPGVIGSPNAKDDPVVVRGGEVHGSTVVGPAFIDRAVLSDESSIKGVVASGTVLAAQLRGEPDSPLAFMAGNLGVNVMERGDRHPEKRRQFANWLTDSPFDKEAIDLEKGSFNERTVKAQTAAEHKKLARAAKERLEEFAAQYGPIYSYSGQLRAGLLNIRNAVRILTHIGVNGELEIAQKLGALAEGVEYLLGVRPELSVQAAAQLNNFYAVHQAADVLSRLHRDGKTVSLENWPEKSSPHGISLAEAEKIVRDGVEIYQATGKPNVRVQRLDPEKIVKEGLYPNANFYSERLGQLAEDIARVPDILDALKLAIQPRPALGIAQNAGLTPHESPVAIAAAQGPR